jgi:hypothetical protein
LAVPPEADEPVIQVVVTARPDGFVVPCIPTLAGVRFVRTARLIDTDAPQRAGVQTEVIITIVLVILVAAYFMSIAVH